MKKFWTEDKIETIKEYYCKIGQGAEKELVKIFPESSEKAIRDRITSCIKKGIFERHINDEYKYVRKVNEKHINYIMKNINKMSFKKISKELNLSLCTVYTYYHRYKNLYKKTSKNIDNMKTKYNEFKEKVTIMLYRPLDLLDLKKYEIDFLKDELEVSEEVLMYFRNKYLKENKCVRGYDIK